MIQIKKYLFGMIASVLLLGSCDDIFRDAPYNRLSQESIWADPLLLDEYVLPWYRNMSNGYSIYMPTSSWLKSMTRDFLPWYGDQITVSRNDWYNNSYGDVLKCRENEITRRSLNEWTNCYTRIQSINLLLENAGKISEGSQKQRILGEAHFFRAYYYYMLLRRYGGVLLIDRTYDPLNDKTKFPRAPFADMVAFIADEASQAATLLPVAYEQADAGRVTRGAALMLKAKTYQWASSPVFQRKEKDFLGFTDDRILDMLRQAKATYEELFTLGYKLMTIEGTTQDEIKEEYRTIFLTKNSIESIFEVQHSDDGNFDTGFGHKLDREASAPSFGGIYAAYTPTQNHVDEYGMRGGKTVVDPAHPYENRDYRFYANILYDGCTFRNHVMEIHYTLFGGKEQAGADLTRYGTSHNAGVTRTGYYLGKFVNEKQPIDTDDTYGSSQNYIIWRYAEALLDYAEVVFRLGDTETALAKVNEIRRRVHMDALTSLDWESLVNERRVELAFEESTYWDLLRWGIAEERMNGSSNPLKAMKIVREEGKPDVYTVSNMNAKPEAVRVFKPMQYYWPIPWDEVRYQNIEQNPGWVEL